MYVELHCHSNFSLLDGAAFPEQLVEAARAAGMPALALTDHDALYAVPRFQASAKKAGIKPIIGTEITLDNGCHVTLLVKEKRGYENLCQVITRSHLSGSKGNPSLSFSCLAAHSEGLICLSGCRKGEIALHLLKGEREEAREAVKRYLSVFGPRRFYLELQHHLHPDDSRLCRQLLEVGRLYHISPVACNNVHYLTRADHRIHDVLVCIRNRVNLDNSAPFRKPNSEYYFKNGEEMALLPGLPVDAVHRTALVADECHFELDFSSYRFPEFPLPDRITAEQQVKRLCMERAERRYGGVPEEVAKRLDQEFELIRTKGLYGYFLIVWDIIEFARRNAIPAQGRGSAASSLVAYLLGITPVDPLKHRLFIGRFLNEFAVPDIDVDIATHRRDEVLRYVYEKYGEEHAAMVCTYITFKGRNAVREVGKVLGVPSHLVDRMAKTLSGYGASHVIKDLGGIEEFKDYLGSDAWRHFSWLCTRIADFPRHLSIHVGGMIICSKPISEMVPLERARAEGRVVCQWDKDGVDDAGLIKVDLLGLRMLSLIDESVRLIKERGIELDFETMSEDDPAVYELITRADTVGVFQVESRAQMQTLPRLRPRSMEDLGAEVAIIRPGPLQGNMVHPYLSRRQGLEKVNQLHPLLGPILDETLGVVLYQEQILEVAIAIAGFTSGEANLLRKAMGRKHAHEEIEKWRARFIEGGKARGVEEATAKRIFDLIGGFAEFGFCKSHAMSFAILCYRSAFLKVHYPVEFYCALLNNQPMGFYMPEVVVGDAKRHGVRILPVDINKSRWECTPEDAAIRVGFRYVNELGEERTARIVTTREKAPFASFRDFYFRTRLDRESLQNLIVVGAFDGVEGSRRQVLWKSGFLHANTRGGMELETAQKVRLDEMNRTEKLLADYTIHGFSPNGHLLDEYRERLTKGGTMKSSRIEAIESGNHVKVAGFTVCLQVPPTAKGFAFLTLEDEEGLMNIVLQPDIYRAYRQVVRLDPLIVVHGVVEKKDGLTNIMARDITRL